MHHFSKRSQNFISHNIWILPLFLCISGGNAVKIRYVGSTECDRYTVDAVYHEKFKIITDNIFKDSKEFVNRVADVVADSLTAAMADLPDRDSSDNEERRVYMQFKSIKNAFASRVKRVHKNITAKWDELIATSFDLLYDNGNSSLNLYLNKALNVTDAYKDARNVLDMSMAAFVSFVKGVIRDGLQGISMAAAESLKKEPEDKKESTDDKESIAGNAKEEELSYDEKLENKKIEIIEMVIKGFIRNISLEVLKQKIDLFKKITIKPEDRDSALDDILFDMLLFKNRIRAIVHDDIPNEKGSIDLARRSIYTYWAEQAETMYKEKIKSRKSTSPGGDMYYKKLWSNEKELMDTLIDLMEIYD